MQDLKQQYLSIKAKYADAILLFRVGDFYESFGDDARLIADLLGTTLSETEDADLKFNTSFPHIELDRHLHKLVKKGFRVAICEQLEDPRTTKGIVKRGVTGLME